METNTSGDRVLTQWFERARFEWHPDQPAEFRVLLGLLGNEVSGPCGPPPAGNFSAGPNARGEYCVKWKDTFTDERGFRIRIEYGRTNETFTYDVRANTTWFIVPAAEAPRFDPPACRRADYSLTVFALRPRGETIVNGQAVDSECGASLP